MKHFLKFLIVFFLSNLLAGAQTSSKRHTIKKGETVYKISRLYNVSVNSIFNLNPESRTIIRTGETLLLPDNAVSVNTNNTTSSNNEDTIVYKVKRGDTKFLLARKYGISIAELERQNPNTVRMLMAGDIINVSGATVDNNANTMASNPTTEQVTPSTTTQNDSFVLYKVPKGETLWGIARANNISIGALRAANTDLLRGVLKAGQDLRIPNNDTYTAVSSTTKPPTIVEESTTSTSSTTTNGYTSYIVQKGDTKFGLANRVFNTTIRELERLNPKIKRMLIAGQEITVPSTTTVIANTTVAEPVITEAEIIETQPEVTETSTEVIDSSSVTQPEVINSETVETPTEIVENSTEVIDSSTVTQPEVIEPVETPIETPVETVETVSQTIDSTEVESSEVVENVTETLTTPNENETTSTEETATNEVDGRYEDYTVKPSETLYGLAQQAGMTMQDFLELNPQLIDSVQTGMVIKMPKSNVADVDASTVSTPTVTSEDLLGSKYTNLISSVSATKIADIVMTLPFSEAGFETYTTASIDFHRVLDEHTKNHLEFYRGAKIAIDSLKSQGIRLNLTILDKSTEELNPNIQTDIDQNEAVVITPFYNSEDHSNLDLISNKNATIVTTSNELSDLGFNNVFEAVPSLNAKRLKMLNYLNEKNANVIVVSDTERQESKTFIEANTNNAKFLGVKPNGTFTTQELIDLLDPNQKNFVIIDSEKNNTFLSTTNVLLTQLAKNDIQLVILEEALIPDNTKVSTKRFSILKMLFPSLSAPSKTLSYIKFINRYTSEYGGKPPLNALIGFDITYDTVLRLSQSETFDQTSNTITEYLALKFNYKQYASGNYYNDGMYILYYDTSDTIKEAN